MVDEAMRFKRFVNSYEKKKKQMYTPIYVLLCIIKINKQIK